MIYKTRDIAKCIAIMASLAVLAGCNETSMAQRTHKMGKVESQTIPMAKTRAFAYTVQTENVVDGCIPPKLLGILAHIRKETGVKPVLTSGHRRHGRSGSLHKKCLAADIRVPGVSDRVVMAAARRAPGIGGVGQYCNGIIHVDIGPRREWNFCGRRRHFAQKT